MTTSEDSVATLERPAEKIKNANQNPLIVSNIATYSGPIPHSSELANYERIVPGSAAKIIGMAEKQADFRHRMEEKSLDHNAALADKEINERKLGQFFAFLITMSTIIGGLVLAFFGKPLVGTIFGGSGLAAILYVFCSGRTASLSKKNIC